MKVVILLISLLGISPLWAGVIVDVYGVDSITATHILQQYGSLVRYVEKNRMNEFVQANYGKNNPKKAEEILKKREKLIKDIRASGNFLFVDLQTIHYPLREDFYTTIEIISDDQPWRMNFIPKNSKEEYAKSSDIIQKMIDFQQIAMNLLITNKTDPKNDYCPVFHCFAPFSNPTLAPYLTEFNKAVIKDKSKIIMTLNQDKNPERRAAAAFLLGHLKDPKKIIDLLIPHINDENDLVRNNVMRVLAATITKANITDINVIPFIQQLDSPYVTDRNKALYVLAAIANSDTAKREIIKHGREKLLQVLRLKQPNNHEIAYLILKIISNQSYADDDIKKWEKWSKEVYLDKKASMT